VARLGGRISRLMGLLAKRGIEINQWSGGFGVRGPSEGRRGGRVTWSWGKAGAIISVILEHYKVGSC
jgi:hypothetical protein